jgi:hypothetical protein
MRSFDRSGCKEGRNIPVAGRDKYTNKSNLFEAIHYQSCQGKKALSRSFNATFASDIKRTCEGLVSSAPVRSILEDSLGSLKDSFPT